MNVIHIKLPTSDKVATGLTFVRIISLSCPVLAIISFRNWLKSLKVALVSALVVDNSHWVSCVPTSVREFGTQTVSRVVADDTLIHVSFTRDLSLADQLVIFALTTTSPLPLSPVISNSRSNSVIIDADTFLTAGCRDDDVETGMMMQTMMQMMMKQE